MKSLRFALAAVILTAIPLVAQTVLPTVAPLLTSDFQSDGACKVFYRPGSGKGKPVRLAELDFDTNKLLVRVNGNLHRLAMNSEKWTPKRETGCVVGDTCIEKWSDGKVSVELSYKVVKSGYELMQFKGTMKVTADGSTQTLPVEGETGS
jgi:hypothetical protein